MFIMNKSTVNTCYNEVFGITISVRYKRSSVLIEVICIKNATNGPKTTSL